MSVGATLRSGLLAALLLGCASSAQDRRYGPPGRSFRQECELPAVAGPDLVLEARRTVVDGDTREEGGELAWSATSCRADVPDCVVVPPGVMSAVYDDVRGSTARGFVSENERVSPHFGFRTLSVRWNGGSCAFVDGVTDPLVPADHARFQHAYDAVVAGIARYRALPRAAIADCRERLETAVASYNAAHRSPLPLLKTSEASEPGHHGEAPYAAFTLEGSASTLTLLWQKGRDLGDAPWSELAGSAAPRVVIRKQGGTTAMLSGSDADAAAFFAAFRPVVDACLRTFDGR
ncbi:MAG: hypothetical protein HOO96_39815 [Polyangiaceae bacterium]|nr:hypothetical protein [Polyangiaceae bacterium]